MTQHEILLSNVPDHRLLRVPGGTFRMGSPDDDPDAQANEKPAHDVQLDDFFIGEYPVTQDLWEAVTGENPSYFKGARRPVENVSWDTVNDLFLPRLRILCDDPLLRLPTEAEWEYAARGGPYAQTEPYRYAGSDLLPQVGWYDANSGNETREVGLLLPNALGLYDLSGNVWEWCSDPYDKKYYEQFRTSPAKNPTGPKADSGAVLRGGSWLYYDHDCRVARRLWRNRSFRLNNFGLRLARRA